MPTKKGEQLQRLHPTPRERWRRAGRFELWFFDEACMRLR